MKITALMSIPYGKGGLPPKMLLIMRLVLLLMTVASLQVSAGGWAQTVTLSEKNAPLGKVFTEIRKQTSYQFVYNIQMLENSGTVTISVKNADLKDVLDICLQDKPFTYTIVEKTIVIKNKEPIHAPEPAGLMPPVIVTGTVRGAEGTPLEGVSVVMKGSTRGVSTNAAGKFEISLANDRATLVFSMVGYKDYEVKLNGSGKPLVVVMQVEDSRMDEVVVTGYQTIQKKLFTGSATSLKADDVKIPGMTDVSRMLEGRAAGVTIQNVSGTFGAAPKVRVRGATSINGENKPLWVVDGIVLEDVVNISNDQLASGDPSTLLGSAVAGLNIEDIATFEILKDASATALYGGRAMNGVIVITTKKGRSGKPAISYNGNFTVKLKPSYNNYNIMNSADQMSVYSEMQRKGWLNYPDILRASDGGVFTKMAKLINTYDESSGAFGLENTPEAKAGFLKRYALANTDWFDILFRNSLTQDHSLSISSGTPDAQYYFSTSFMNDQGWTIGDNVKRYTANMRANYKLSEKLSAGLMSTASVRQQRAPGSSTRVADVVEGKYSRDFDINPFSYALNTSRVLTAYEEDGKLEYFNRNYAPFNIINELDNNSIQLNMMDLKLQGELGFKFTKNLEYKTIGAIRYVKTSREHEVRENSNMALAYRANYDNIINDRNRFLYSDPDNPDADNAVVLPEGGFYNRNEDQLLNYYLRNSLTWKHESGENHTFNVLLGQEIKYTDRQNSWNNGYGYQYDKGGTPFTDYRIIKQMLEGNFNYFGMDLKYDRFVAFFSNAIYSYKDKYVFNGTFRYDGSNKMGKSPTARWLPTWTVSGAWNMEEEDFMRGAHGVDYLKIRAAYGLTASIGPATNSSVILSNGSTRRPVFSDIEPQISISSLENSELTWEKQYEANLGFDLSLLQNKWALTVDVYKRNGFDLIGDIKTNGIGGQASKTANYADMKSQGIEVTLGTRLVKTRNWTYHTNLTFGYNVNTVINLKSIPRIIDLIRAEGGPKEGGTVRGLYSIPFVGNEHLMGSPVFIGEDYKDADAIYVQGLTTDFLKYEGPVDPTITGGFNHTLSYRNLSLNVFFSYQLGNKIRLDPAYKAAYNDLDAMPREFLDRWTLPGDELISEVPSILYWLNEGRLDGIYPYTNYNYTPVRVADGSFVRLKTASLMYRLKPGGLKKVGVKTIDLNAVATNLWLIYADPKLKGQDPEFFASGGVALPMPRQFTLSLKLGF